MFELRWQQGKLKITSAHGGVTVRRGHVQQQCRLLGGQTGHLQFARRFYDGVALVLHELPLLAKLAAFNIARFLVMRRQLLACAV